MKKTSALILVFLVVSVGCGTRTIVRERTIIKYQHEPVREQNKVTNFSVNYPKQAAEGYFESGKMAYGNSDFQEAMRDFAMVLNSSAPADIRAKSYVYMGACCFYEGRLPEAREFCKKARETNPEIRLNSEEFPREVIEFCN